MIPLLKETQYDTVYHEHLRYYTVTSLKKLFSKFGLQIFDVEKIPTHGGSIRVYCSYKNKFKVKNSVQNFLKNEKNILNLKFLKNLKIMLFSQSLNC